MKHAILTPKEVSMFNHCVLNVLKPAQIRLQLQLKKYQNEMKYRGRFIDNIPSQII